MAERAAQLVEVSASLARRHAITLAGQ